MPEVLVMDHKNNYKSINKTFQSLSTFKKFKGMEAYQKKTFLKTIDVRLKRNYRPSHVLTS